MPAFSISGRIASNRFSSSRPNPVRHSGFAPPYQNSSNAPLYFACTAHDALKKSGFLNGLPVSRNTMNGYSAPAEASDRTATRTPRIDFMVAL